MLVEQARAAPGIAARPPRPGLDQNLHAAVRRDAEKPETQQPAELAHPWIALAAAAPRAAHGQPDLIAGHAPIDALQHELEVEAELQFTDDHERRLLAPDRDEIAAADLAFDVKAEGLEETLHREVQRRFPPRRPFSSPMRHDCLHTRRICLLRSPIRVLPATLSPTP